MRAFSDYPKWKYHAFERPRQVASEAEEASLGSDWGDAYQYQEWPKYVALPAGGYVIVNGPDEAEELEKGLAEPEGAQAEKRSAPAPRKRKK